MENGFSSPRTDAFPAGLRVLVVDDDPTWLKILEKMLKKCSYEVTTCCLARNALDLLRERKDGFDIVISDVNMPDMDGFKLLEHVGLEMDLPVIMMSVDGETSRVMKGVQHGACDYLLKPIRMKELRNIWQHVFRKKIHEVRDIESYDSFDDFPIMINASEQSDDAHFQRGGDMASGRKRKDIENKHEDKDFGDATAKKARVVWSVDLHQKFVKAVNHIGFDIGPKKILDLMNVPWLTRENVASHLQKYRLYLSRLQKESDLKSSIGGIKHSDLSSKEPSGSMVLQNSMNVHEIEITNGNFGFSGNKVLLQNTDLKIHENNLKGTVSLPLIEPTKTFGSLESDLNYGVFDSPIPNQFPWTGEIPKRTQFKDDHKPRIQLLDGFSHLPRPGPGPHHIQVPPSAIEVKPPFSEFKINQAKHTTQIANENSFSDHCGTHIGNLDTFERISTNPLGLKSQSFNQKAININDFETWKSGSAFTLVDKDLQLCWVQSNGFAMNIGLENTQISTNNDLGIIAETPINLYDALRFDYEDLYDSTEYSIVDQGLFIT